MSIYYSNFQIQYTFLSYVVSNFKFDDPKVTISNNCIAWKWKAIDLCHIYFIIQLVSGVGVPHKLGFIMILKNLYLFIYLFYIKNHPLIKKNVTCVTSIVILYFNSFFNKLVSYKVILNFSYHYKFYNLILAFKWLKIYIFLININCLNRRWKIIGLFVAQYFLSQHKFFISLVIKWIYFHFYNQDSTYASWDVRSIIVARILRRTTYSSKVIWFHAILYQTLLTHISKHIVTTYSNNKVIWFHATLH